MRLERAPLQRDVIFLNHIIEKRQTLPILGMIRLEVHPAGLLSLTATDLEIGATVHHTPLVDDVGPGVVCVNGAQLATILRALPKRQGTVDLEFDEGPGDTVILKIGSATIPTLPADDFPPVSEVSAANPWQHCDLTGLRVVAPAISHDESRYNLNGVRLDLVGQRLVATDGHRIHLTGAVLPSPAKCGLGKEDHVIVSRKAVTLLMMGLTGPAILLKPGFATFPLGNGHMMCKLIEAQFPNIANVIPKAHDQPNVLEIIDTAAFAETVRSAMAVAEKRNKPVRIDMNGAVKISASSMDLGSFSEETLAAVYHGAEIIFGINGYYLLDALQAAAGAKFAGKVTLRFSDGLSTVTVYRQDEDTPVAVVMPMRI